MKKLVHAVFALSALVSAARADDIPPCRPGWADTKAVALSKAPAALRTALARDVGEMAEPGGSFNATDVVDPRLPANRLIFVWQHADFWLVATEHGGIAYSDPVRLYRMSGSKADLVETRSAIPNTVCAMANALLARDEK